MKTHTFIFAICAVSVLAFFGCSPKKSAERAKASAQVDSAQTSQNEDISDNPSLPESEA